MSDRLVDLDTGELAGSTEDRNALNGGPNPNAVPNRSGSGGGGFIPGTTNSGQRTQDGRSVNFWGGAATPGNMQTNLGPTQTSGTVNGLDPTASGYNGGLAAQLWAQSQGKGPSIAQQQLQMGTDQNLRSAAALAAGGRSPGMASYQAAQNQAAGAQTMAGQSAMARLQEQYQSQAALAGLTNQMQNAYGQNAQMQQQNGQFNASQGNQMNLAQGQLSQGANQFYNQLMAQQQGGFNNYQFQHDLGQQQADNQLRNGLVSSAPGAAGSMAGALPGLAAMASDRRLKKNVRPARKEIRSFLDKLKGSKSYEYKESASGMPGVSAGRHVSVMAQDLESAGPVGKSMVDDTPRGKVVNYGRGLAAMLAAQSDLHERVKKLEG